MTPSDAKETPGEAPNLPDAKTLLRRRMLRFLIVFATLFIVALAGSWGYRAIFRGDHPPAEPVVEEPKDPVKRIGHGVTRAALVERADKALLHHHYAEALGIYEEIQERGSGEAAPIAYRQGLCCEALGHLDQAIASYRTAISAASTRNLNVASHLSLARCLLRRNRPVESRHLLHPFLLDAIGCQETAAAFLADANFLVALALAREATPARAERLAPDELAPFSAAALEMPFYLDEIAVPHESKAPAPQNPEPAPAPLVVTKATDKTLALLVHVNLTQQPAWKLLDQLAVAGGLRVEWSASAKKKLEDRTLHLHLRDRILRDVLEDAADSLDVVCLVDGTVARFSIAAETDKKRLPIYRRELAQRCLHDAIRADGAHVWAPAAHLEMGNAAFADEKWGDAKRWYESVAQEAPSSRFVTAACFNLAEVYVRQKQFTRARKAFFRVVDNAPGHELALRAYLKIGQLYLDEEDSTEAVVHLRHAQSMAPLSPYHPVVTLTLAAGYMHQGELDKARQTLSRYRSVLQKEPYKATAAFLDTFAQYRRAKLADAGVEPRREASDLISTLWRDQDDTLLGPYGLWLLAEAYRDMGFPAHAEKLLRKALTMTQGPFVACLEYTLAETLAKPGPSEEATKLLLNLAEIDTPFRPKAKFQLARLDLQGQRYQECIARCQELWSAKSFADSSALFHLWGSALEAVGDLARAAQCFAGRAPE